MALENLSEKLSELAQTGVAKTKELVDVGMTKAKEVSEICRLKVDNASEQEAIKKAYLEIGKLYFAERGMDPEAPYSALCEKIGASKAKIAYNLERIEDLKAAGAPVSAQPEADGAEEEPECTCTCGEDAAPAEGEPECTCTCGEDAAPAEGEPECTCTCGEDAAPAEEEPECTCTCGEDAAPAEEQPEEPKE